MCYRRSCSFGIPSPSNPPAISRFGRGNVFVPISPRSRWSNKRCSPKGNLVCSAPAPRACGCQHREESKDWALGEADRPGSFQSSCPQPANLGGKSRERPKLARLCLFDTRRWGKQPLPRLEFPCLRQMTQRALGEDAVTGAPRKIGATDKLRAGYDFPDRSKQELRV